MSCEHFVEVSSLSRRFGQTIALNDISLSVSRGIVLGLVGENGAGKTTLIKHLLGLFKAQQGTVTVFGLDPVRDPVGVLGRIGYLSEDRDLPDWMRVGELMRYNQAFYPAWDEAFAGELREMFNLDASQRVKSLSRGQRARVGLLIALAHRPDLLVLDEPSSGLDPIVRRDILMAIVRTIADEGRTVLFSSHLLDEVQRVADSVAMLHEGRLVLDQPVDQLLANFCRVTLRFETPPAGEPDLPGVIFWTGEDREWTAICNGDVDALRQAAHTAKAELVEEASASLEEIFMASVKSQDNPV